MAVGCGVFLMTIASGPANGQPAAKDWLDKGINFPFQQQPRHDSATIYLTRALTAYTNANDNGGIARTQIAFGNLSLKRKKLPRAKQFFTQALERAQQDKAFELMVDAYDGLANTYQAQKDFKRAITAVRFMQGAYDSIMIRDRRRELDSLENKYTTIVREKDSLLVHAEGQHGLVKTDRLLRQIERNDIRLTFYSVALGLSSVLLFFFAAWVIARQKTKIAESRLKRELAATKLANEQFDIIAHQVRDELSKGLNDIVHGQLLLRSMIDTMWLINPNNKTLEALIAYIREQTNAVLKLSSVNYMIVVPDKIPNVTLTSLERLNLFIVTREVVSHAVKCSKASGLTLSITLEGKQIIFKVKDNSPADDAKVQKRADELKPYREKMEQIYGTIGVIVEQGSMVVIYRKDL
ncbi:MAG TPA: hypothetical protein VFE50_24720 [Cyclobacteriaceae bacterium]|nr:hypothetical protein [Cyclobacteriaceae bacterium]